MSTRTWRDSPLPTKIGAIVVAVALVPLVVLTLITAIYNRAVVLQAARDQNLQRAYGTAQVIETLLAERLTDLSALAVTPEIVATTGSASGRAGRLASVNGLLARTRDAQDFAALFVVSHDGAVVAGTAPNLIGRRGLAARLLTRALAGEPVLDGPRYVSGDQTFYMQAAYPVVGAERTVVGAVVGRFLMDQIERAIAGDTGFSGHATYGLLLDTDGVRLSVPARPDLLFRPVGRLDDTARAELLADDRFGSRTADLLVAQEPLPGLVEHARWLRYEPEAEPHLRVETNGVHHVTLVPLTDRDWTYGIVARESDLLAAWRNETERAVGLLLLTALLTIGSATLAARWLSAPLGLVVEAARALGAGDLTRRVGLRQRDEVGQLASAFDSMADSIASKNAELRRHTERLEQEVQTRTAALSASEAQTRAVLRAVPDLMFRIDRDGHFLEYLSAPSADLLLPPERFVGKRIDAVMPPPVASRTLSAVAEALEHHKLEVFEYELRLPGDSGDEPHVYEARIYPDGPYSVLCMVRDVTVRRRAEKETRFLGEATARLTESLDFDQIIGRLARLAVPSIADLCTVDIVEEDRLITVAITAVNAEQQALATELRRRYPIDPEGPSSVARAAREGRSQLVRELSADVRSRLARDADHLDLLERLGGRSAMAVPLVARGSVIGVMGFLLTERERGFTDHDLRRAEALAERAAPAVDNARLHRELQLANRMKDEFLGIVSHELRTPLNAVLGWARLLQSGGLDEDRSRHALNAIYRNAQSQRQLIEDLLDASRIISGKLRLEEHLLRLAEVVEAALDAVRPAAEARHIGLAADLEAASSTVVSGDPARLQQVFWNLLANAVKFTPEQGDVRVGSRVAGDWIEVSIEDSGVGIAPSFLPYVFDRFRQADSTTTRAHGGLGLGLAIARHLAERHGGTIRVWSAGEQQGSTFTVRLPIQQAPERTEGEADQSRSLVAGSLPVPVRVLVVDDDGDSRELLRTLLSGAGARVTVAASAEDAIEHCTVQAPDVVISDIGMPEQDGFAFLEELRRLEESRRLPPVPAIAVTAYARAEDRRRALDAGFQEHLGKPVDPAALVQAVLRAIDRSDRDLSAGGRSH